jgi:hypothetical protein
VPHTCWLTFLLQWLPFLPSNESFIGTTMTLFIATMAQFFSSSMGLFIATMARFFCHKELNKDES